MTSPLRTLLDRVEQGEGADREIDTDVMAACFPEWAAREPNLLGAHCAGEEPIYFHAPDWLRKQPVPCLTSSIDAAVSLVEKVLPGYDTEVFRDREAKLVTVDIAMNVGQHAEEPRATLLALLRAKIAQEERT